MVALEAEVSSADAALGALRSQMQNLAARLEGAQGRVLYQEQASLAPAGPVASSPGPRAQGDQAFARTRWPQCGTRRWTWAEPSSPTLRPAR